MDWAGKAALLAVQLAGLVLSALLIVVTFANPEQVEERLQEFAIAKVERTVDDAWTAGAGQVEEDNRTERLQALARRFGVDAEEIDLKRQQIVPALLAKSMTDDCKENCDFWVAASTLTNAVMLQRVAKLRFGQTTLQDFVLERYEASVHGLLIDLRRFGMVNVIVLSLMIGLVLLRDQLNWRFAAFSVAVTGYTAWAAYGYVFNQNWALSILLQDWAAPGYQAGMIFAACLFFDWLFLRGKITEIIGNLVASILPG